MFSKFLINWKKRLPRLQTCRLYQKNLYVLPTKTALMLSLTLLVLLLATINFQLNLGYILIFWLFGASFISLFFAHRNLYGIALSVDKSKPIFQGENAQINLSLFCENRPRFAISLAFDSEKNSKNNKNKKRKFINLDLNPNQKQNINLSFIPENRGLNKIPLIYIQTFFPLGFFRVWSYFKSSEKILVYPKPEIPCPPVKFSTDFENNSKEKIKNSQIIFDSAKGEDLRNFQRGDSLRDIYWKKTAQVLANGSDEFIVRTNLSKNSPLNLWLDAKNCETSNLEAQISRLTAWSLYAKEQNWTWGLILPSGKKIGLGSGDFHLQNCLYALALD